MRLSLPTKKKASELAVDSSQQKPVAEPVFLITRHVSRIPVHQIPKGVWGPDTGSKHGESHPARDHHNSSAPNKLKQALLLWSWNFLA